MLKRYKVYYQDGLFERELPFSGATKERVERIAKEYLENMGYEFLRIEEVTIFHGWSGVDASN